MALNKGQCNMKKTNNFGKYNAARKAIVAYTGVTYRKASAILKQLNKGK